MGDPNKTLNYANLQGSMIGRYRLENLLGIGGMGNVYKSHHPDLKRDIAVKILHPHLTQTPDFIERFRHEAAAAGSLAHPHIIQVYDFSVSEGGLYYMVMQFINGPSLEEYIALEREPLTFGKSYRILAPVAAALHFAHEQGIVHRDVKPGNIMLDTRQNPFLGDFGLAKIVGVDLHTAVDFGPGTPAYMAPEQIEKGELGRPTDIYALGLILYKMLTLRLPFEGENLMQIIRRKTMEPARSPADFNPQLPAEVVTVIRRAIASEPEARYPDAMTFIEAYWEAIQNQGIPIPRYALDAAFSSGIVVTRPGIFVEGYKIQREFIEPHNRPYQRYLAQNETLAALAVLTVLKSTTPENPILSRLFHERLEKLALLDHPGIFAITRADETNDQRSFCAYEFIPGRSLATKLSETWNTAESALPVVEALRLCRQIAEPLAMAARANLWHNDLNPANIIIKSNQTPVLVGWEIPLPPPLGDNRSGADEPGYIAPEQLTGDGVTAQSVLFCLGVMAYELLTGHRPVMPGWRTRPYSPADIPQASLITQPGRFASPETQTLLSRCLATNPADRFPDFPAFLEQTDRAIAAEQRRQQDQAPPLLIVGEVSGETTGNTPKRWLLTVVVLLLLLLLVSGGIYIGQRQLTAMSGDVPSGDVPSGDVPPTATAISEPTTPLNPVLVIPTSQTLTATPASGSVTILGPAAGSQYTLDDRVVFGWRGPRTLADDEQFAVYFLGGDEPILVGVVSSPVEEGSDHYQLAVRGRDILATEATVVWQVQLLSDQASAPLASSPVTLITFVLPTVTPSLTPSRTPRPTSIPTLPTTSTTSPMPTATSRSCQQPGGWITYLVQSGDTLPDLAVRTGITAAAIRQANCLEDGAGLTVGQVLWLPTVPATATAVATPSPIPVPTTNPSPDPTQTSPVLPSPTTPPSPPPTFTPPALPTLTPPPGP